MRPSPLRSPAPRRARGASAASLRAAAHPSARARAATPADWQRAEAGASLDSLALRFGRSADPSAFEVPVAPDRLAQRCVGAMSAHLVCDLGRSEYGSRLRDGEVLLLDQAEGGRLALGHRRKQVLDAHRQLVSDGELVGRRPLRGDAWVAPALAVDPGRVGTRAFTPPSAHVVEEQPTPDREHPWQDTCTTPIACSRAVHT